MWIVTEETTVEEEDDRPFEIGETVELRSSGALAKITGIRKKEIRILLNGKENYKKNLALRFEEASDSIFSVISSLSLIR